MGKTIEKEELEANHVVFQSEKIGYILKIFSHLHFINLSSALYIQQFRQI
ncbi:MAG: hypothetical protein HS132_19295 [Planctomycetia bacterium]|nr:hypothetical protein [Planctomycetia bacterium]